jgi:hypothetical protein
MVVRISKAVRDQASTAIQNPTVGFPLRRTWKFVEKLQTTRIPLGNSQMCLLKRQRVPINKRSILQINGHEIISFPKKPKNLPLNQNFFNISIPFFTPFQSDFPQFRTGFFAFRPGNMGNFRLRMPSNWYSALATAGAVGTRPISPTPFAP